jgi:hypothetical protein
MAHRKTIKFFLIDGDSNGRMSCELSNWIGKAYKIPRIKVRECSDRDDLVSTGIYLLFGKDEEGSDLVYIGEAESVLNRLKQHLTGKEFWNETIVFISKDDSLNKAHVKYLENRLHDIALTTRRYKVENSMIPTQSSLSESERAEMEEFVDNIKMLVNILGHKVFDKKRVHNLRNELDFFLVKDSSDTESNAEPKLDRDFFYIKSPKGADAQGELTSDGFVVFKDSIANNMIMDSSPSGWKFTRQKLIETAVLVKKNECFEFAEDYIATSPSSAAAIVMGREASGPLEWKLKNGTTLKDYEQKK